MSLNGHNNSNVTKFAGDGFINHDVTEDVTSPVVYYVVASMLTFTCFVGTFFNGVAIFVFAKNKHLRTPTNSFVMSLCACDLLMCLIGMPIPAVYAWGKTTIDNQAICVFDGFTVYFLGLSSMYLLAAISVDRYVVIVRPMASTMVTQRVASLAIGVCFLMGLFWTMMPLLGWNHYVPEGIRVACSISWESGDSAAASYVFAIFVFCLLLPMTIMVFCYANIYRAIRNIGRNSPWGANSHIAQNNFRLERKMLKTIVVMVGAFLISWAPYAVVSMCQTFTGEPIVGRVVETFPALIAKMSAIWDPVIYIATNLQFRRAFFDVCPVCEVCLGMCDSDQVSDSSETAMDPESRAVLDDATDKRQTRQDRPHLQVPSDTPKAKGPQVGVGHDNITLETTFSPEKRGSSRLGGGGNGGPKKAFEMTPVESAPSCSNAISEV